MARCLLRILALVGAFLADCPGRPGGAVRPARRGALVDRLLGRLRVVPRQRVQAPGRDRGLDRRPGARLAAGRRRPDGLLVHAPRRDRRLAGGARGRPRTSRPRRAQLLAAAQASSGCTTPIIALNEMAGQDSPTPWSAGTAAYRDERPRARDGADARRRAPVPAGARHARTRRTSREMPRAGGGSSRRSRTSCSRSTRRRRRSLAAGSLLGSRALRVSFRDGAAVVPRDQRAARAGSA